jgi:predicted nucleotidyltransferase
MIGPMTSHRSEVLERSLLALRQREPSLRAKGVLHAAVFGSVARGDERDDSDVDVLVELDREAKIGTPEMLQIEHDLAAVLGRRVEVVSRGGLKSPKHDHIIAEMVAAF